MFGLSFTHLILLAVLALVFLGPEQLPEVARTIARLLNEWKRATGDIQSHLTNTFREDLNINRMVDPNLTQPPQQADAAPTMPNVQPADHLVPIAPGPTIVHDPHAPTPESTGHTEPTLPVGHKPDGDDQT